jgi:hypothetical protein
MIHPSLDSPILKEEMKVYWIVTYTKGLTLVKNPEYDIFDSREEALKEAENRGDGWQPVVLNPEDALIELSKQNLFLRKENRILRGALDTE